MKVCSPAPWTVESTDANGWKGLSIRAADGTFIANLVMQPGAENERVHANLIAVAPAMLAALKVLRNDANRLCDRNLGGTYEADCRRAVAAAAAVIYRAEGR